MKGAWIKKDMLTLADYDSLTCAEGILIELAEVEGLEWKWEPISE